jgi:anti-sigma B factor antagonist
MKWQLTVDHSGDVAVVRCAGRIVRGDSLYALREAVTRQQNARIVILDLSEVTILDGGGLGMLVSLARWAGDNGTQLKLVNPSRLVREILERTRLTCVFEISSMEEALVILGCEGHDEFRYAVAS